MDEEKSPNAKRKLERDGDRLEQHLVQGWERIIEWYDAETDEERKEATGLNRPPHESILDKGALYIVAAVNQYKSRDIREFGHGVNIESDEYYITISIGTEYLLNAILLKANPARFKEETNENWKSPSFGGLTDIVCDELLADEIEEPQRNLIYDTLQILKTQRDNYVHLGFHGHDHSYHPELLHYVLAFLVKTHFNREDLQSELISYADAEYYTESDYEPLDLR